MGPKYAFVKVYIEDTLKRHPSGIFTASFGFSSTTEFPLDLFKGSQRFNLQWDS